MPSTLEKSARLRLAAALDRDGVVAAILHGSQATGRAGPISDIDVGVWVDPRLDAAARLEVRLNLERDLPDERVDLVVLNDAAPLLAHRARQSGVLLVDRHPRTRMRLETQALIEYLDTNHLREELARATRNRLAEGRFGR